MDRDHVVDVDKLKGEHTPYITPSTSPTIGENRLEPSEASSCVVCRNVLLLSYFNCCAVCGSVIPCGRTDQEDTYSSERRNDPHHAFDRLPPAHEKPQNATTNCNERLHCQSAYCRYTHNPWLLRFFILCELMPATGALMMIAMALAKHDFAHLRFGGMMAVQWWQIFVLPRQWHAGTSIFSGQLFYIEGRQLWRWWEPFAVSTVLLKILFPW
ncbi:hypothetical protein F4778DRAFT_782164 [Xylariomycetidae sp. FL2044]|nr:hypothetical protein F4778DRAFT_782164 [Xylariomycetidae sp. FL2044]